MGMDADTDTDNFKIHFTIFHSKNIQENSYSTPQKSYSILQHSATYYWKPTVPPKHNILLACTNNLLAIMKIGMATVLLESLATKKLQFLLTSETTAIVSRLYWLYVHALDLDTVQ